MKNKETYRYFKLSMMNIGIMQVSCGILGLIQLVEIFTQRLRTGRGPGEKMFIVPEALATSIYLFLGLTVLLRKKWTKILQLIFTPLISLMILESVIFLGRKNLEDYLIAGLYLGVGAITIFYNLVTVKRKLQ